MLQEAADAAKLEALRMSDPESYPPPPPEEPEAEPQPEPDPEPIFEVPDSMYKETADAVGLSSLYATVPELPAEEVFARKRRYRCVLCLSCVYVLCVCVFLALVSVCVVYVFCMFCVCLRVHVCLCCLRVLPGTLHCIVLDMGGASCVSCVLCL